MSLFSYFFGERARHRSWGFFRKKYENDRMQFAKITSLNAELSGHF